MWRFDCFKDNVAALREDGKEVTYSELQEATSVLKRHIPDRCLIFILCGNEVGSLLGYVTSISNRIVPLLLDARLDRGLLASLIDAYKPDYLWLPNIMQNEFETFASVCSIFDYSLLKTPYAKVHSLHDELALLMTTSGSTGSPKLVRQSYKNIRANTESIVEYLKLDETERPITTLPMSYTYGLSIINSHLYVGASTILTPKTLMQKEFWQQFKEFKATSFGGVPFTYEMLNKLRFFRMELPSLRTMTQAGGKLSPELHKKFAKYAKEQGKHFVVMYGQTEGTARMSYLPHEISLEKCGSVGIAIPGGNFSLMDIDRNKIAEAEVTGELVYEGANVTLGNAECGEDLIKGDERNGILVTGDLARRDDDGYYYIVGRKKRFLKIFGNRVNLDEVELLIKAKFESLDCACTGIDDAMYIFVTDDSVLDDMRHFITEKTGLNRTAFKIKHIVTIPKKESGKTLYIDLEKYYD